MTALIAAALGWSVWELRRQRRTREEADVYDEPWFA